jgi:hypothetical protein
LRRIINLGGRKPQRMHSNKTFKIFVRAVEESKRSLARRQKGEWAPRKGRRSRSLLLREVKQRRETTHQG